MMRTDDSALVALVHEYADAVRFRDADRWGATWADDAVWVLGPDREVSGREAIVALWSGAMARYATVNQVYGSCSFDVDAAAGTASGRCQLTETNRTADGAPHVLLGHYDDTYVRTGEGWRFASRRLTKYYAGAPDLSGTFDALG